MKKFMPRANNTPNPFGLVPSPYNLVGSNVILVPMFKTVPFGFPVCGGTCGIPQRRCEFLVSMLSPPSFFGGDRREMLVLIFSTKHPASTPESDGYPADPEHITEISPNT